MIDNTLDYLNDHKLLANECLHGALSGSPGYWWFEPGTVDGDGGLFLDFDDLALEQRPRMAPQP